MKVSYNCKENDVKIQFHFTDGEIDEVWIKVDGEDGWTVIGYNDLISGIRKAKRKLNDRFPQKRYTAEEFLKAAKLGEVSMIDAKHIVSLLDEIL